MELSSVFPFGLSWSLLVWSYSEASCFVVHKKLTKWGCASLIKFRRWVTSVELPNWISQVQFACLRAAKALKPIECIYPFVLMWIQKDSQELNKSEICSNWEESWRYVARKWYIANLSTALMNGGHYHDGHSEVCDGITGTKFHFESHCHLMITYIAFFCTRYLAPVSWPFSGAV
jgi:hypothetical protein